MDKQRKTIDTRRPNYAVFRRRRRVALLIFLLLATLILGSLGLYLLSDTTEETVDETAEQVEAPPAEEPRETAIEEEPVEEEPVEEEPRAPAVPEDPTLYLTVPKLGLYGHTVRNDDSEIALDMGAVKLPDTGFPWEQKDTNTYIACHRLGWPGNESYNQCLNLPSMQTGDEISLADTKGRIYRYQVIDNVIVTPEETWVTQPVAGRDLISLQTCVENPDDVHTLGPNWLARYITRAERVA